MKNSKYKPWEMFCIGIENQFFVFLKEMKNAKEARASFYFDFCIFVYNMDVLKCID